MENAFVRYHDGETMAIGDIFKTLYRQLYYYALKILDRDDEANDIVIEAFLKLYDKPNDFSNLKHLTGFLYTVIRNACMDKHQLWKRQKDIHAEISYLYKEGELDTALSDKAEQSEIMSEVLRQIELLPDQQKMILALHYKSGLSTKDIAEKLGLSVQTVRNQKIRGIRAIQKKMGVSRLWHVLWFICYLYNRLK